MSAIVAALTILTGGALAGCGQRGPLYQPTVPPLPAKPIEQTQPPSPDDVKPGAETASEIPDTSGTGLSLSPDEDFRVPSNGGTTGTPQQPASSVPQAQ
ncbi:MAG TPA: lipoprotein [Paraburkholderia sp.]|jgi:predicted small lipoprotein YifL